MTTKHTPGPWRIGTAGPNGCMTIGTKDGLMVAVIAHSLNENDQRETAQANARLIAAAPDLLEALTFMTNEMRGLGLVSPYAQRITGQADAAIAKATGAA